MFYLIFTVIFCFCVGLTTLARVISLTMTCRRAPYSASTLQTLEIMTTTCRRPPSPVSTLRTPEPEWRSWAPRLVARVWVVVVAALALELPLVVVVGVVLAPLVGAGASLGIPVGADHHRETGRPADAARPVSKKRTFPSK